MKKFLLIVGLIGCVVSASAGDIVAGQKAFKKCAGCHGAMGERKALGKSKVISNFTAKEIVIALKGYKDGTYGGPMKGLMKGQVATLSDANIEDISTFLTSKK